jgi:hypothetical protein
MVDTFVPNKPERFVTVKISSREADLLTRLRKYAFGKFVVHKTNGLIIRLEVNDSQIIDSDGEIDLT